MGIICRHFDKDRNGRLEHQEFKSCLRSLGYDLALLESGETDPEFEAVLDQVDPNRYEPVIIVSVVLQQFTNVCVGMGTFY